MVDDIYIVNLIAKDGETVTVQNTSPAPDWIIFTGGFEETTEIRLAWDVSLGVTLASSAIYFVRNNSGQLVGSRVIVQAAVENARGSTGEDFIQGNERNNILYGDADADGAGDKDTIWGFDGNDTIFGGADTDTISGDNGDDKLWGDAGSDTISGGAGKDTIEGGAGADSMSGGGDLGDYLAYTRSDAGVTIRLTFGEATLGRGGDAFGDTITGFINVLGSEFNDRIIDTVAGTVAFKGNDNVFDGGGGADVLDLGGGNDSGLGADGNDTILGGVGRDLLAGEDGSDRLVGGDGNDYASGNAGADNVAGEAGDDRLYGGAGRDILNGGTGVDRITGGADADIFIFATATDSRPANPDSITDFTSGTDVIDLTRIDANLATAAKEDLTFIGTAGFSGTAGEVRFVVQDEGTLVQINLDSNRRADMQIYLDNTFALAEGDFVLA